MAFERIGLYDINHALARVLRDHGRFGRRPNLG